LHAYTGYRAARQRPVQLVALTRHVRWLSLFFHTGVRVLDRALTPGDFGLPVRTSHGAHRSWRRPLDADSVSSSTGRFSLDALTDVGPTPDTPTVREWMRPCVTCSDHPQHYFVAAEIRALYLACDTLFERILFTSLFTTGMRIGGFCTLTHEPHQPVAGEIRGVEKGNVSTTYCVTDVLCTLLNEWIEQHARSNASRYLFAGRDGGPDAHVAPSTVRRAFHRVAQRAGVTGSHVHPHTTRHTVAWTLHALGNSVERVAGFVGHRSPQVTSRVYIALTQAQQRALVDCPWLGATKTGDARRRMRQEAEEMARAICSPFGSTDGRTFPVHAPSEMAHQGHPTKGTVKALGRMARAYLHTHNIA
jgi:desulfoferrodoxin (superoxide reductase-like protein)